ncbi:MAG: hypothetical protein K8J31_24210, partial [Anaerolineae bacterium]|nr:hypothetical protein [Anaerolineae bacterium]
CGAGAGWLYANPEANTWVAGYHGPAAPLTLTVPGGAVTIEALSTGTIVWQDGEVSVEAVDLQGVPRVTNGRLAE